MLYNAKRVSVTLHYFTKNPAERERKEVKLFEKCLIDSIYSVSSGYYLDISM